MRSSSTALGNVRDSLFPPFLLLSIQLIVASPTLFFRSKSLSVFGVISNSSILVDQICISTGLSGATDVWFSLALHDNGIIPLYYYYY